MPVRLERVDIPVTGLTSKQYTMETTTGLPAICCPGCGGISDVPETHMPLKDERGRYLSERLRYVWSCPYETCPFWDFVRLGGLLEAP